MNNKKNWIWIIENFDFSGMENDIQIEDRIWIIKKYNDVELTKNEAMYLSELINCRNTLNKIHKLTK